MSRLAVRPVGSSGGSVQVRSGYKPESSMLQVAGQCTPTVIMNAGGMCLQHGALLHQVFQVPVLPGMFGILPALLPGLLLGRPLFLCNVS